MAIIVSFMLCVLLLPPKKQVKKKTAFENYVYALCLSLARTVKEIPNRKYT